MKNKFYIRTLTVFLLLAISIGCVSFASAASQIHSIYTDELTLVSEPGGKASLFIYAESKDAGWFESNDIELTFTKGYLHANYYYKGSSNLEGGGWMYPAIEARIWVWEPLVQDWVVEQNYDIYNKSEHTVELQKENHRYRIELYFWNASTVADSYGRKDIFGYSEPWAHDGVASAAWINGTAPAVTARAESVALIYTQDPFLPFVLN